jgi:hypothetical protein
MVLYNPETTYPYYYDPTNSQSTPDNNISSHEFLHRLLSFYDAPADPCLPGGLGVVLEIINCGGVVPAGTESLFTTELIGILSGTNIGLPLFDWQWIDTFNGTSGGITKLNNFDPVDLGSGSGGITVIDVNGASVVPEPPSLTILIFGIVSSVFIKTVVIKLTTKRIV